MIHREWDGGGVLAKHHAASVAVAPDLMHGRVLDDFGRDSAAWSLKYGYVMQTKIIEAKCSQRDFVLGGPLGAPFLLQADERPEEFNEKGTPVARADHVVEILVA